MEQNSHNNKVAYDLMNKIADCERDSTNQDRHYFFKLFNECKDIVNGSKSDEDLLAEQQLLEVDQLFKSSSIPTRNMPFGVN